MRFHSSLSSFLLSIFIIAMSLPAVSCKPRGLKIKPYPTPHVIASTPSGTQQGDVTLSYTLIEVDGSGADISLEYSTDGGSSWQVATAKGGSGTTDVKGIIYPGIGRTIVWDSVADVVGYETCRVRIVARKSLSGKTGTPDETGEFEVQNPQVPVISWVSKPEGTVREVPLTFTWQYDTPQFPIQGYFYNLDGQPPMQTVSTSVTIPAPSTGMHTFQVYAASLTGNVSNLLEATFTCDNAALNLPPTVVITSGPSGTTTDTKPTFEYSGSDPDGSITGYFVSIDVDPPDIWISANSWTSPALSCGSHTFYVMAQDNEGANSSIATRAFTVDTVVLPNQPPTVNILSGPSGTTNDNTPTFTYEGLDNDGTIAGYFVSIDVNPPDIWTTENSWTSPELSCGSYTFYVMAQDNDGANSSVASRSFQVIIPVAIYIYVDGANGDNSNDGTSWATAVKTIAKGLEMAGASGSTVLVADGTYTGPNNKDLNFNGKSIYLVSANGSQNCIIDCQDQGRGFHFYNGEGNSAVIDSISIINGNVAAYAYPSGGAILVESGCAPKIINCVIESCAADPKGGGIYCDDSTDVELVNCVFKLNYAANCGGGVYISEFASGKLSDCLIDRNSSGDYCGGIFAAAVRMENCSITRNTATFSQGGAFIIGNSVLTGCTIFGNRAKANGGDSGGAYVICDSAETSQIINCLIVSNQAGGCGGGLDLIGGLHMIINCTFANNFALEDGGGIRIQGNTDAQIYNSIIWANIAGNEGNQINSWQLTSIAVLQFCDFENNTLNPNNIKGPGSFSEFNCLHTDPQFLIFPADEDYHLDTSSPCIDAGCNALVPPGITTDLDGEPRIIDGDVPADGTATVDIGPYETQITIYVDCVNGDNASDGRSWATAVDTIQRGINLADNGTEVIVADGNYTGIQNKDIYFYGKSIYLHSANGSASCIIDCENSGTGFICDSGETRSSVIDGFTIKSGNYQRGAGIFCTSGSSPTIINCIISNNIAVLGGGGIYCNENCFPEIRNCLITNNNGGKAGGGIYCDVNSGPLIDYCTIDNNATFDMLDGDGGGIHCHDGSNVSITNCIIKNNVADGDGDGGGISCTRSSPYISNCAIIDNYCDDGGGGITSWFASPTILDCMINGNIAYSGSGIYLGGGDAYVSGCVISGSSQHGIYCRGGTTATIVNCSIVDNPTRGVLCYNTTAVFSRCRITNNSGGVVCDSSSPLFINCLISNNTTNRGGGVFCFDGATPTFICCTIANNQADNGGGIYCRDTSNTIFNNVILWGNLAFDSGHQIYFADATASLSLNYCDFANNSLSPNNIIGPGSYSVSSCIISDPLFINSGAGNYRLGPASPCIDTGSNALLAPGFIFDLDGNPRFVDGIAPWDGPKVDMGAYEYQP